MTEEERRRAILELERLRENRLNMEFVINAEVYRAADGGDCTNGGESSMFRDLYVFAYWMSRQAALLYIEQERLDIRKCMQVQKRHLFGEDHYSLRPISDDRWHKWSMMGGNFAYSCDSRYRDVTGGLWYPIPIHDRTEEQN